MAVCKSCKVVIDYSDMKVFMDKYGIDENEAGTFSAYVSDNVPAFLEAQAEQYKEELDESE